MRHKEAPGGGRALAAAHSFGPGGAGDRGAEDTGGEGSAHRGLLRLASPGRAGRSPNRIGNLIFNPNNLVALIMQHSEVLA